MPPILKWLLKFVGIKCRPSAKDVIQTETARNFGYLFDEVARVSKMLETLEEVCRKSRHTEIKTQPHIPGAPYRLVELNSSSNTTQNI